MYVGGCMLDEMDDGWMDGWMEWVDGMMLWI